MGIMRLIKSAWIKKKIKDAKKISSFEKDLDFMLADELKTMAATNRTAEKALKLKLMRQETRRTLENVRELDDEDEDEYEDEGEDIESKITNALLQKFLGGAGVNQSPTETGGGEGESLTSPNPVLAAVGAMTPDEMKQLKDKFLK